MQNNIPTVMHFSEINCYTVNLKAIIFLLFLACCTKKIIKIEIIVLLWQHEPAFSVD